MHFNSQSAQRMLLKGVQIAHIWRLFSGCNYGTVRLYTSLYHYTKWDYGIRLSDIMTLISNYSHVTLGGVITHPWFNFNGGFTCILQTERGMITSMGNGSKTYINIA